MQDRWSLSLFHRFLALSLIFLANQALAHSSFSKPGTEVEKRLPSCKTPQNWGTPFVALQRPHSPCSRYRGSDDVTLAPVITVYHKKLRTQKSTINF